MRHLFTQPLGATRNAYLKNGDAAYLAAAVTNITAAVISLPGFCTPNNASGVTGDYLCGSQTYISNMRGYFNYLTTYDIAARQTSFSAYQDALDGMFLESAAIYVSFDNYTAVCAPDACTYYAIVNTDAFATFSIALGILGGIQSAILALFSVIWELYKQVKRYLEGEEGGEAAVDAGRRGEGGVARLVHGPGPESSMRPALGPFAGPARGLRFGIGGLQAHPGPPVLVGQAPHRGPPVGSGAEPAAAASLALGKLPSESGLDGQAQEQHVARGRPGAGEEYPPGTSGGPVAGQDLASGVGLAAAVFAEEGPSFQGPRVAALEMQVAALSAQLEFLSGRLDAGGQA